MPAFIGHTILTSQSPTPRLVRACTPFGLCVRRGTDASGSSDEPARLLRTGLASPGVALLCGPSGCGKSRTLTALAAQLGQARQRWLTLSSGQDLPDGASTLLVDLLGTDVSPEQTLAHLAAFGLAQPALLARRLCELSEGQQHRARLALLFHCASRQGARWLLLDEFCSVLDRITAASVAQTLARVARRSALRVVCATAHDDIAEHLRPDMILRFDSSGRWQSLEPAGASPERSIVIEVGTRCDMERLLPHHYLAGPPATRTLYLRAFDRAHDELAGVLVVSMPTLNGIWRAQAWPGRYSGRDRRRALARLNAEVRCISRVIVDPRYRGRGIARRLVEAYLARPQTPATEAIAAMGGFCPFFERAGMTCYHVPRAAADARLADAIESLGLEAWMLADPERAASIVRRPLIRRELDRWARLRHLNATEPAELARLAAARLCVEPRAYAHVSPHGTASDRRRGGTRRERSHPEQR
ncbi:MAG: hypothetical protein Kow0022_11300 [Phycisphaerales bacterium]